MEQRVLGGRYLLKDKVGTGGMATVAHAQDQVLDRTVAVKIMLPQYASDATFAARFGRGPAAAGLSSPLSWASHDWGKDGDTYYIVMVTCAVPTQERHRKPRRPRSKEGRADRLADQLRAFGRPQARDHPPRH